jgi:hypothetical protein
LSEGSLKVKENTPPVPDTSNSNGVLSGGVRFFYDCYKTSFNRAMPASTLFVERTIEHKINTGTNKVIDYRYISSSNLP